MHPGISEADTFLWTADKGMRRIGDFEAIAVDINASGQVVGQDQIPNGSSGADYALLWTAEEGMQALNVASGVKDSGWRLEAANGINDAGQIVGQGKNPDGEEHAFLLTPVQLLCQGRVPTVLGGAGNDIVCGGKGKNKLSGGSGKDTCKQGVKRSGCER
jgi:probable HAF family extracellular repeat protein